MNVQELAQLAYDSLESRTRATADGSGERFITTKDDAPDWVSDLIRDAAHSSARYLPDDYLYDIAQDMLEQIADGAGPDSWDSCEGDPYTSNLVRWMQVPGAIDACDDVLAMGLEFQSMTDIIMYAQGHQKEQIRQAIYDWLTEHEEELQPVEA